MTHIKKYIMTHLAIHELQGMPGRLDCLEGLPYGKYCTGRFHCTLRGPLFAWRLSQFEDSRHTVNM